MDKDQLKVIITDLRNYILDEYPNINIEFFMEKDIDKYIKTCNYSKKDISDIITPFWFWLIKEAKVDVIDAEKAIEVHGFKEDNNLIPVVSFKELLDFYKSKIE